MIRDRFNFLMQLTGTTNASFGDALNFDVSYISRIRRGNRKFPDNPEFLIRCSGYFSDEIFNKKLQKEAASILNSSQPWPAQKEDSENLIYQWLLNDPLPSDHKPEVKQHTSDVSESNGILTYYGYQGRRDALMKAFSILCENQEAYDILIYSNESLTWFTEDGNFFLKWREACLKLLHSGSSMTLINYLNRSTEEMSEGLKMWVPLFLTGNIRAFYYDRISDDLFDRTLFVVRKKMALTCNALRLNNYPAVNTLFLDEKAADSFAVEFDGYLSLCKPLLHTFSDHDALSLRCFWEDFTECTADLYFFSSSPAFFCLSDELAEQISVRTGSPAFAETAKKSAGSVRKLLNDGRSVNLILLFPQLRDLLQGRVYFPMQQLYGQAVQCSAAEYLRFLESVLQLSSQYRNFHVCIGFTTKLPESFFTLLKKDFGLFLGVTRPVCRTFYLSKPDLLSCFQSILLRYNTIQNLPMVNELRIRSYIADIRKAISGS